MNECTTLSHPVTSADDARMTLGFHSKYFTFSIHSYHSGALLFLCQQGRDDVVKEELYQGTSKGAKEYAACLAFNRAMEEGINIAFHWQDTDSSFSNAMTEHQRS